MKRLDSAIKHAEKLFNEGKWDWKAFQDSLQQFVDPENGQFGIDGWWFEAGLSATCGVPYIGLKDGKLVNNLKDPAIERLQNWMFELGTTNCVAIGVGDYGWTAMPNYIGEGKTLYYPCGAWALYNDTWKKDFGENAFRCRRTRMLPSITSPAASTAMSWSRAARIRKALQSLQPASA